MYKEFFKKYIHYVTVAALSVCLLLTILNNGYWKKNHVIVWDIYGYTQYLSAGFIYNDIRDPKELTYIDSAYKPAGGALYYGRHCVGDSCKTIAFKYAIGNAIMMAPFYLTAHAITKHSDTYPADGYSRPYQLSVVLSNLFWAICGMFALVVLLRRWFSPLVVSITLFLIVVGTNYFYYGALEYGMTHIPSFFCVSLALLSMFNWLETKKWKWAIVFGAASGMVAAIRIPDLVFGIIPAILFIKQFTEEDKQTRLKLLGQGFVAVGFLVLFFSPQMLYWKYVSDSWFLYSYKGEAFHFDNPRIADGLFSYRKGWLLYTPLMWFALAGMAIVVKRMRWLGIAMLLFFAINVYVIFSWHNWWYGGSFGARCMIQSYPIMAIPLAFVVQWLFQTQLSLKGIRKIPGLALCTIILFFIALNLFQIYQYKRGTLHYENMTQKAYWGIFGKLSLTNEEYDKYFDGGVSPYPDEE